MIVRMLPPRTGQHMGSISRAISCIATSFEGERRAVEQLEHEGVRAALHTAGQPRDGGKVA